MWYRINSKLVPEDQAFIHVKDRGFRLGDGVFETVRLHRGIPYQWELHLARMKNGLDALGITFSQENLASYASELVKKNDVTEGLLRITVTRGEGSQGYLPLPGGTPTLVMETLPLPDAISDPVDLWTATWQKPSKRHLPIEAKLIQGVNSMLARMEAKQKNCFEALMLGDNAQLCEGSSSNIFWLKKDVLYTPSLRAGIIPGTTRAAVIRLSPWKVQEGIFLIKDIEEVEEFFITNAAWQIVPVKALYPLELEWNTHEAATLLSALIKDDMANYVSTRT